MKINESTTLEKEKHMIKAVTNLNHTTNTTKNELLKQASMLENIQMFIVGMVGSVWGAFA